ncbi:sensor of ECF-type sigma factor [Flavobacterium sp.]|uniref:sensor of ECF-type sigma factor n=1 Tax=Flavobacterium sp. TaxID=239 RepID=UPI002624A581|nr:sensor of ECF-type sigma factor [Flavobacterium sp.]
MKTIVNKSQFVILLMTLACTLSTIAQPPGRMRERIKEKKEQVKSQKIAFITQELNLSPDEAAKFWPIYNAYDEKQAEIRKQKVNAFMDRNDSDALDRLTEKEAQNALSQMENTEDELHKLRKKFLADIKNVLPSVKILKLKRAEEAFNRKLIERLRERRGRK